MTWSSFLNQLGIITLLLLALVVSLAHAYSRPDILQLYLLCVSIFVVFCIGMFWYARLISRHSQNFTFFGVVSGSFFIKLVIALVFLFYYQRLVEPDGNGFAIHFIIVYIVYTIYEVFFLTKLAKPTED